MNLAIPADWLVAAGGGVVPAVLEPAHPGARGSEPLSCLHSFRRLWHLDLLFRGAGRSLALQERPAQADRLGGWGACSVPGPVPRVRRTRRQGRGAGRSGEPQPQINPKCAWGQSAGVPGPFPDLV